VAAFNFDASAGAIAKRYVKEVGTDRRRGLADPAMHP
jgi:hypothetical protein